MIILKSEISLNLPLSNPVIIFSLVLFIILFAPILLNKIKIPHLIGLIIAGVVIGPHGLNLLRRDSSIILFGTVGLLYIMFLAGLEIDLNEFKKNRGKVAFLGLMTFALPLTVGALASYYVLGYGIMSSILLASMFSTHTLIAYPIASKYGVARNKAVTLTVGSTMITDILALLILAAIAGMAKGDISTSYWVKFGISTLAFVSIVFFIFPIIARWFFKRFSDNVSQYIFVLAIVFLAAFLAETAGLEPIIGAFFAGLVLNRFIPRFSPLMNRIDFVGNALFIPFFLIGVGMLVDVTVLVKGLGALKVAGVIITVAIATKYGAAMITKYVFKLTKDEGRIIFGLSTSHAAATLAIILVGYNIIIGQSASGEPIRLLDEDVLNGTILLILFSCTLGSFVVERAARNIAALDEEAKTSETENSEPTEKLLIFIEHPDTVTDLVDMGLLLKHQKSRIPVYALNIVSDDGGDGKPIAASGKMMNKALMHAAATENKIIPVNRYDINISNGIIYSIKEHNISDVLIGVHRNNNRKEFFGAIEDNVLTAISETIYFYNPVQPLNTLNRIVVVVTQSAEMEPGFLHWYRKIMTIAKATDMPIIIYASDETIIKLRQINQAVPLLINVTFNTFSIWDEFLIFTGILRADDLFVVISSRRGHISHNSVLDKMHYYLSKHFNNISFILLYPKQLEHGVKMEDIQHPDASLMDILVDQADAVNKTGNFLKNIFRSRKRHHNG